MINTLTFYAKHHFQHMALAILLKEAYNLCVNNQLFQFIGEPQVQKGSSEEYEGFDMVGRVETTNDAGIYSDLVHKFKRRCTN